TTSALALTLEGSPIWDFEIAGFRSGDFAVGDHNLTEGLFMLHPNRTGRMPVVLVHGTASSPARWAELVNELENDPQFWEHYEIWLFMYNTGNPIAYSAMLLRDALTKAVADLDPEGKNPGLKQMVVIGHSQGGLLTKMTVIDTGMRLWPFTVPPEELGVSAETRDLLVRALIFKPLPFVRRVIFIATPHGGSYQALGFFGRLGSWFVNLPGRFVKMQVELLTLQTQGLYMGTVGNVPTSITNMTPGNAFIKALAAIPIADGVVAHSIIAVDSEGPLKDAGDGVVKYESAHIEGVESEKIVHSGHSVQGNPEAIQEDQAYSARARRRIVHTTTSSGFDLKLGYDTTSNREEEKMDFNQIMQTITTIAIAFGLKIIGAIVVWVVGRYLISLAVRLVSNALEKQRVDPTVLRYLGAVVSVTLNIILVIAILGYFGVETTTFAALFAATGVAVGLAWSGLLANFAAGAFMIILRPIKVGDFVTAGGVTGTVREIGLFVTVINTPDNVQTVVGNNKIFSDTIQNFSTNP